LVRYAVVIALVGFGTSSAAGGGWTPVGLTGGGGMFVPAISSLDSNHMIVNCDMSDAFLTRDGGENWTMIHHRQLSGNVWCRPVFHPRDKNIVFAVGGWNDRLRISRDGGIYWEEWGDLPEGAVELAVDQGRPDLMLAALGDGGVFFSTDGGAHWIKSQGIPDRVYGLHIDQTSPVGTRTCLAGAGTGVFRSRDGGATWETIRARGLPLDLIKSGKERDPGEACPGFTGGSSEKSGECVLYFVTRTVVVGGKLAGGVYRSVDRGETWERAMGPGINLDIKQADEWAEGPFPRYHHVLANNAEPRTVYVASTSSGYNPPHHATVYRSDDRGRSWRATWFSDPRWKEYNCEDDMTTASRGASYNATPLGLSISPADPRVLVMTNAGQCFITRDGGKRWMASHARRTSTEKPLARDEEWRCNGLVVTTTWNYYVDPHDPVRHYICYTDMGMARSTDGGKNWRWWGDESGSPWHNTCYELAFDPDVPGKIWGAFSDVHDIPNGNIIWGRGESA